MYSNETKETISSKSNLPSFVHDYQTYLTKKKMKMPTVRVFFNIAGYFTTENKCFQVIQVGVGLWRVSESLR